MSTIINKVNFICIAINLVIASMIAICFKNGVAIFRFALTGKTSLLATFTCMIALATLIGFLFKIRDNYIESNYKVFYKNKPVDTEQIQREHDCLTGLFLIVIMIIIY